MQGLTAGAYGGNPITQFGAVPPVAASPGFAGLRGPRAKRADMALRASSMPLPLAGHLEHCA